MQTSNLWRGNWKRHQNMERLLLSSWICRINILKITTLPNAICKFSVISMKICMALYTEIVKAILNEEINAGWIARRGFNLYYRAIIIKTAWNWHKSRHRGQWNKENSNMNVHNNIHLILTKMTKLSPCKKKMSSANDAGKTKCPHIEEWN